MEKPTLDGQSARKAATRRRIVEAAARLFIQKGASAVSADEIAAAAGVSRRSFFNHFAAKDELYAGVAAPILEEASRLVRGRLDRPDPDYGIGGLCGELWLTWGRDLEIIYSMDLGRTGRLADLHSAYRDAFGRFVAGWLASRGLSPDFTPLASRLVYRCFLPVFAALADEPDGVARAGVALEALLAAALAGTPA